VAVRARNTGALAVMENRWWRVDSVLVLRDTGNVRVEGNAESATATAPDTLPPTLPAELARLAPGAEGLERVPASDDARRERSAIVVDEWGPFDWRSPKLWPVDSVRAVPLRLAVFGPSGRWRVVGRRGIARVSAETGRVGDTLTVTPDSVAAGDWEITLEYRGGATVSARGVRWAAGTPVRFSYGRFEPAIQWTSRYFAWSDSTDPRHHPDAFQALLRASPLLARQEPRLDLMWYRPAIRELPQERWALEATGTVTLAPGWYTLRTIGDDAVRVWVDGALAIDDWEPGESRVRHALLAGGRHELRVQSYQVGGWVELRVEIVRGTQHSTGTPGSH
jgi:hypothetical protein